MTISAEEVEAIGASLDSAQFPPEVGGGYMAGIEVVHQVRVDLWLRRFYCCGYCCCDRPGDVHR